MTGTAGAGGVVEGALPGSSGDGGILCIGRGPAASGAYADEASWPSVQESVDRPPLLSSEGHTVGVSPTPEEATLRLFRAGGAGCGAEARGSPLIRPRPCSLRRLRCEASRPLVQGRVGKSPFLSSKGRAVRSLASRSPKRALSSISSGWSSHRFVTGGLWLRASVSCSGGEMRASSPGRLGRGWGPRGGGVWGTYGAGVGYYSRGGLRGGSGGRGARGWSL